MSQANLDALERLYAQWSAGDWTDASLFDPYAVGVLPDPAPRPHYGLEALGTYWRRFLDGFQGVRMEAVSYREAENTILVTVRRLAQGASSGLEVEDRAIHVWTFRGAKVIRLEVFEEESEALEASPALAE